MAEYSYDAWGRMRNVSNWTVYIAGTEPALLFGRGYTGHEHLPQFGLINMNARLYDPVLGRFVSADPYVADPTSAQAFNWYMYVGNNPLMFTDPTGERRRLLENLPGEEIPQGAFDTWDSGIHFGRTSSWSYMDAYRSAMLDGYQGSLFAFPSSCREQQRRIGFNGEITYTVKVRQPYSDCLNPAGSLGQVSCTAPAKTRTYTINLNDYGSNGGNSGISFYDASGSSLEDLKNNPPSHPDYKSPKGGNRKVRNPNGGGWGWADRRGHVWVPTDHKGTHAPHWDKENPDGTHTNVYPEPESDSEPTDDSNLRDKIGDAVGLGGTALTIYIIISEGSRLFPPRNLVPVP